MAYLYLAIAIVSEVIATSALKISNGFTNPLPSFIVIIGYAAAFYFLSIVLRTMSVGIAYALWSGIGVVLIVAVGAVLFKQIPDLPAIAGMILIVLGVVIINTFSNTISH